MFNLCIDGNKLIFSYCGIEKDFIYDLDDFDFNMVKIIHNNFLKILETESIVEYDKLIDLDDDMIHISYDNTDFEKLRVIIEEMNNYNLCVSVNNNSLFIDSINSVNNLNNLYIDYQRTSDPASYDEYMSMMKKVYSIIDKINKCKLSEIEKVMYVYDLVKANEYKEVDNEIFNNKSRNLHEVLKDDNDKIVCVGFSNMLNFILNEMGISITDVDVCYYNYPSSGHQRSMVLINDDKYNIHGLFQLDPTGDCKDNDLYINNYNYFLESLRYMGCLSSNEYYEKAGLNVFSKYIDVDKLYKSKNYKMINTLLFELRYVCKVAKNGLDYGDINNFLINDQKDIDVVKSQYDYCFNVVNQQLPVNVFAKALYVVRKNQFNNGIIDQMPDEDEIKSVVFKKYFKKMKRVPNKDCKKNISLQLLLLELDSIKDDNEVLVRIKKEK